jgi:predicted TIM-barrel fold metal-dependent hydrolase
MSTMFFDAFTEIGPRVRKHPAAAWKLEHVVAEMEHCSISAAMVGSTLSVSYEAMHENLALSARIAGDDRLHAVWNALPDAAGDFPAPAELVRLMRKHDVRAVSLHPHLESDNWDILAASSQPLLSHLAAERILTIIDMRQLKDYRDLDAVLQRHPTLRVLLLAARWNDQRHLLPIFRARKNLHITFDRLQAHLLVEQLVEEGHADRLLYASYAPHMAMGAHRCYIDYAEVPEAARRKIAGGNLVRLLGLKAPPRTRENRDEDPIMAAARRGERLPVPVIDMHMHILHEGMNGAGATVMRDGGPSGVHRLIERLGVTGGGFMSWNGVVSADTMGGNEVVAKTLDASPPGFWGLASIDPAHYGPSEMRDLVPKIHADPRMVGMKPYYVHGIQYHHKSWAPWWRYGNEHSLYALIHRGRDDFAEVDALAEKYPRVRWVVAHCGESHRIADMAIESMLRHRNVFAEITLTPVAFGLIDYLVEHAGVDRVVYGSDLPMRDPRQQLGWVVFSRLGFEAKRRVLGANAARILAPCLRGLPARNRPPPTEPVVRARRRSR